MSSAPILYYARGACSFAPHVVLEELGKPFEAIRIDPAKGENRTPDYLKLHPRGHVPVLVHGDLVLTESAAIATYVADLSPESGLAPRPGTRERARMQEWQGVIASAVHVAHRQIKRPARFSDEPEAHASIQEHGRGYFRRLATEIERRIGDATWLLGDYSVVDPYLQVFHRSGLLDGIDFAPYPNWNAHSARVLARPAVRRVMTREGLALPER